MKTSDNRKYHRTNISLSRDVSIKEFATGRKMKCRMTSISTGGIGITAEVYMPLGMKAVVSFRIREGAEFKDLVAKVVTVKNLSEGFSAGLEFIGLNEEVSKRLKEVVDGIAALHGMKHFEFLTHEEAVFLRSICEEISFQKNECIYSEGKENIFFYAVGEGQVGIIKDTKVEGGKEEVIELIKEHDFFGETALFDLKSTATARALSDCVLFRLSREDFDGLYASECRLASKLMIWLVKSLSRRIKILDQELVDAIYPDSVRVLVPKSARS